MAKLEELKAKLLPIVKKQARIKLPEPIKLSSGKMSDVYFDGRKVTLHPEGITLFARAILELVPFVGPIFAGSIAVLVGVGESFSLGMYVLILFIVLQQIEGHILVPLVTRFTTSLNAAVVLISLLVGGETLGFVGLVVAVPAAVFLQEVVENWTQYKARRRVAA